MQKACFLAFTDHLSKIYKEMADMRQDYEAVKRIHDLIGGLTYDYAVSELTVERFKPARIKQIVVFICEIKDADQ